MSSEPKRKLRIVLDSNVLVSALGFQKRTRKIWDLAEEGRFELFVSTFILSETERVLIEKLGLEPGTAEDIVDEVAQIASKVEFPERRLSIIKVDDSDNAILECAVEARADVLVTGDLRHLRPLNSFQDIAILTPREFLDKYFSEA